MFVFVGGVVSVLGCGRCVFLLIFLALLLLFTFYRKQVAPSRLNKSPKFDHTNANEQNSFEDQRTLPGDCQSPAGAVDSGIPSPENPSVSNGDLNSEKESLFNGDVDKLSKHTSSEEPGSKQDLLVFTSGSGMIGFTRHPLED